MFIQVRWVLCGFARKELKEGEDKNLWSLSLYYIGVIEFGLWDSSMWKRCLFKNKGEEYGFKMYFEHCYGKWLT